MSAVILNNIMLRVSPFIAMLSAFMLDVLVLSVTMLSVFMLSVLVLSVTMLSVVMLDVIKLNVGWPLPFTSTLA